LSFLQELIDKQLRRRKRLSRIVLGFMAMQLLRLCILLCDLGMYPIPHGNARDYFIPFLPFSW
jgi:hypothetical protein